MKNNIDKIEDITSEDRASLVRNLNYGEIEASDLQQYDIPKMSDVEYVDNILVYEDYSKLDEFLENDFIPENVRLMKKRKSDDLSERLYSFIQLNKIVKLKLSELELKHVIEYLNNQGIYVRGIDSTIDQDFENYDYYRTYKNQPLPKAISSDETLIKLDEYSKTKNIDLKKEIIEDNLRLVPWVAYKYSIMYGIDSKELESYGYEGLIDCIDKFDITLGYKFSTFAVSYIKGYIKRGVIEFYSKEGKKGKWFNDFIRCKRIVEEIQCERLEDNISLATEIVNLMIADGSIPNSSYKSSLRRINILYADSIENMDEELLLSNSEYQEFETDEIIISEQVMMSFLQIISKLTPMEQKVIKLRYGFEGEEIYCLEDLSKILYVTRERVRQIEHKALNKIKRLSAKNDFINSL